MSPGVPYLNASLTTIVLSSGALTEAIGALGLAAFETSERAAFLAAKVSQEYLTSVAVRARPLVGGRASNGILGRSLNVTWVPSGESSQDSAASGSTEPSGGVGYRPTLCLSKRL